ncbi:MAG: hypothetical protein LBH87_03510, partial [Coriobacteriales bacterium]|nr:hypothetical protein [Coriobacteriales bacterium]
MRITVLEHPRLISSDRANDIANAPLSACLQSGYAAAYLQSLGFATDIVEGYLENLSYPEILAILDKQRPSILAVHLVYHWRSNSDLYNFLILLKEQGFCEHIVAFG